MQLRIWVALAFIGGASLLVTAAATSPPAPDNTVVGTFGTSATSLVAGEGTSFIFHVEMNATGDVPPASTSYGGFVTDVVFNGTTFERIPTHVANGSGYFEYTFRAPGTYRVGVNVTGPQVIPRWIGSSFAILAAPPSAASSTAAVAAPGLTLVGAMAAVFGIASMMPRR